jgi:hypothetical protein
VKRLFCQTAVEQILKRNRHYAKKKDLSGATKQPSQFKQPHYAAHAWLMKMEDLERLIRGIALALTVAAASFAKLLSASSII